jgi:hypothetical protein
MYLYFLAGPHYFRDASGGGCVELDCAIVVRSIAEHIATSICSRN